ncbi:MAG TPA: hypothetical protein VKX96_01165, partial [Chloroflexota bacterium]|nr:hypothetical protein [Chloroflexota bacterium]
GANQIVILAFVASNAPTTTCQTDGTGVLINCILSVPTLPAGSYEVDAKSSAGAVLARSSFTITPVVSLTPTSGWVDSSVGVNGQGFNANATMALSFAGGPVSTAAPCLTNALGSLQSGCSFAVPAVPSGTYTVTVSDGTNSASSKFTVIPFVSLSPASGPTGSTVLVSGSNFAPDTPISFLFKGQSVNAPPCVTFSIDTSSPVGGFAGCPLTIPSAPLGSFSLSASDGTSAGMASFTVTEGSGIFPPFFVPVFQGTSSALTNGFSYTTPASLYPNQIPGVQTRLNVGPSGGQAGSVTYGFDVPAGTTQRVVYGMYAGSYLNNGPADIFLNGQQVMTVTNAIGFQGDTASGDLVLWDSGDLPPGAYILTIAAEVSGNQVNVYGLWFSSPPNPILLMPLVARLRPSPTRTGTATPTSSPTPTRTATITATPTKAITATPTLSPTPSATPRPDPTVGTINQGPASPTVTFSPPPTPTSTPTAYGSPSASATASPTASVTTTATPTPSRFTLTPTMVATTSPTATPTAATTYSPTPTPSVAATATPTPSPTPTRPPTSTPSPTAIPTSTATATRKPGQ